MSKSRFPGFDEEWLKKRMVTVFDKHKPKVVPLDQIKKIGGSNSVEFLPKPAKKIPEGVVFIEGVLRDYVGKGVYETEFAGIPGRRFKFDFAIPHVKVAIEFEGLVYMNNKKGSSGKSRHATVTGYSNDCAKYNLAIIHGWRVLRYTAMNYKEFYNDIRKLI